MKTFLQSLFFFLLVTQICFGQWYQQNSGTTATLNSVHFENANNGWTVGENGTIIHTTNAGQEWLTQVSRTSKHLNEVWFADLNTGWIVGDSGTILKTINGGQEWAEQTSGTSINLNSVCFIGINKGWIVGSLDYDRGIILGTTNGGINWISQSYDKLQPILNSVCFVDSITGWAFGLHALFTTTDGGHNWSGVEVHGDGLFTGQFLDPYTGWVSIYSAGVVHGFIVYTTNSGIDWYDGQGNPTALSIYFIDSNNGWAVGHRSMGSESNIYNSIDGGRNWIAQTQIALGSLNSVYFTDIHNGWAVGEGGTILHTTNGGVSFVEEERIDEIPTEFLLSQNYPNPFNPNTKIKYSIPPSNNPLLGGARGGLVTLKVYDVLGNEIETLVNEEKPAGTYEITWYAEQLPSGVYFYRLKAGDFIQTKKMLLLK